MKRPKALTNYTASGGLVAMPAVIPEGSATASQPVLMMLELASAYAIPLCPILGAVLAAVQLYRTLDGDDEDGE